MKHLYYSLLLVLTVSLWGAFSSQAAAPVTFPGVAGAPSESGQTIIFNRTDKVQAYDTDWWTVSLMQGISYTIEINGDGDTDLDYWLYDENDNVIDSDMDGTDLCYLHVTPKWTGKFRIKIKNYGNVYNKYYIKIYYY